MLLELHPKKHKTPRKFRNLQSAFQSTSTKLPQVCRVVQCATITQGGVACSETCHTTSPANIVIVVLGEDEFR
ncbi:hypothetical protein L596_006129 [Steinernema carpocapsae]|uniref:Uncharacterized protein n=1 Tax=Steinernema carpocapsae TaxID=34508 RepID=A0A4U8V6P7_STECR|nr:hypothetical protein L596_006129 [Steinernema carpocapsae]